MREAEFEKALKQTRVIDSLIGLDYPPRSIRPNWKVGKRTFDIGIVDPKTEALIAVFQVNGYEKASRADIPFFFADYIENDLKLGYFIEFDEVTGDGLFTTLKKTPLFKTLQLQLVGQRHF